MGDFFNIFVVGYFAAVAWVFFLWYRTNRTKARQEEAFDKTKNNKVQNDKYIEGKLAANQWALNAFIEALAAFLVTQKEADYPEILEGLASSLHFSHVKPHHNQIVLHALIETKLFQRQRDSLREIQDLLPTNREHASNHTALLLRVHETANRLITASNGLARALKYSSYSRVWQFDQQFLVGAYLDTKDFRYANFNGAFLIGTNFVDANLTGATFDSAVMIYAQMARANLTEASFVSANLTNAKLSKAEMNDADLRDAKVAWSTLNLANNVNDSWQEADFEGATRRDARLRRRMEEKFGRKK